MKRLAITAMILSISIGISASSLPRPFDPDSIPIVALSSEETLEIMARWRKNLDQNRREVVPRVVISDRGSSSFIIPSAGSLQGGGGTFFRSDVTFSNQRTDRAQELFVGWLERGKDNSGGYPAFSLTIPPASIGTFPDFVGQYLELSGLGSIFVIALDQNAEIDSAAVIDGYSRIWTPLPGFAGTVSQQFSSIHPDLLLGESAAIALGVRHDSEFRANVGIVNLDEVAHVWTVNVLSEDDESSTMIPVTVPPLSMMHVAVPQGDFGSTIVGFVIEGATPDFAWSAYATSNDNITGDGWVAIATPQAAAP